MNEGTKERKKEREEGRIVFGFCIPSYRWVELDPCRILESVYECVRGAMSSANAAVEDIVSMGITNQRETTIAWDRTTGRPLCNAICMEFFLPVFFFFFSFLKFGTAALLIL